MTLATITTFQGRLAEDPVKLKGTVRRAAFVVLVNRRTKVENDGGTEEWVDKDTTGHVVKAFNRIAEGIVADTVGKSIRRRRARGPVRQQVGTRGVQVEQRIDRGTCGMSNPAPTMHDRGRDLWDAGTHVGHPVENGEPTRTRTPAGIASTRPGRTFSGKARQ